MLNSSIQELSALRHLVLKFASHLVDFSTRNLETTVKDMVSTIVDFFDAEVLKISYFVLSFFSMQKICCTKMES